MLLELPGRGSGAQAASLHWWQMSDRCGPVLFFIRPFTGNNQSVPPLVEVHTWIHLEQQHQQPSADEERNEAADEPAAPQDPVIQAHDPHGLLQPCLFFINHTLQDDGHRVHPGQGHEQRHGAAHHPQETERGEGSGQNPGQGPTTVGWDSHMSST